MWLARELSQRNCLDFVVNQINTDRLQDIPIVQWKQTLEDNQIVADVSSESGRVVVTEEGRFKSREPADGSNPVGTECCCKSRSLPRS
jgi:hypothetical protein